MKVPTAPIWCTNGTDLVRRRCQFGAPALLIWCAGVANLVRQRRQFGAPASPIWCTGIADFHLPNPNGRRFKSATTFGHCPRTVHVTSAHHPCTVRLPSVHQFVAICAPIWHRQCTCLASDECPLPAGAVPPTCHWRTVCTPFRTPNGHHPRTDSAPSVPESTLQAPIEASIEP